MSYFEKVGQCDSLHNLLFRMILVLQTLSYHREVDQRVQRYSLVSKRQNNPG
jgi:hypothetical protein